MAGTLLYFLMITLVATPTTAAPTSPSAAMPDMASTLLAAGFMAAPPPPPSADDIAAARRLVAAATWGVVSSYDDATSTPFGNILSYADGGTGTPYFYLTRVDGKTAVFADSNPNCSLAVTRYSVDQCPGLDPQEPLCSRVTLSGRLVRLHPDGAEAMFAAAALLKRHSRFNMLPSVANFELYKLEITLPIFFINSYKNSPKMIPVPDYLNVTLF